MEESYILIFNVWNLRRVIGGKTTGPLNFNIEDGVRMCLSWIKGKLDYLNILFVWNVERREKPQKYFMLIIFILGINSLKKDDNIEII